MKIKQKIIILGLGIVMFSLFSPISVSATCTAISGKACCGETLYDTNTEDCCADSQVFTKGEATCCGEVVTTVIKGVNNNCDINSILKLAIDIFTGIVSVVAVGAIIYGGIIYSTAGGSADKTKQAKEIIINTIIGIAVYALMYAILNFVIPGGYKAP